MAVVEVGAKEFVVRWVATLVRWVSQQTSEDQGWL